MGSSRMSFDVESVSISYDGVVVFSDGEGCDFDEAALLERYESGDLAIGIDLGDGGGTARSTGRAAKSFARSWPRSSSGVKGSCAIETSYSPETPVSVPDTRAASKVNTSSSSAASDVDSSEV